MSTDVRKTTSGGVELTQPAMRILFSVTIEQRRGRDAGRALNLPRQDFGKPEPKLAPRWQQHDE